VDLHRESPLFDRELGVQLFQDVSESRQAPLSIRIIPGTRSTGSSGQPERLFHFEVSARVFEAIATCRCVSFPLIHRPKISILMFCSSLYPLHSSVMTADHG
jgi:hypothetical protein